MLVPEQLRMWKVQALEIIISIQYIKHLSYEIAGTS